MKILKLALIFASAANIAATPIDSAIAKTIDDSTPATVVASAHVEQSLGANIITYIETIADDKKIMLLNHDEMAETGPVTPERLKKYLQKHRLLTPHLNDEQTADFLDGLQSDKMVALNVHDPETRSHQVCLISLGKLNRSTIDHISELSSVPPHLLENIIGSAQEWHTTKLLHEFAHCLQPYNRRGMYDFEAGIHMELDADQRMFNLMIQYDRSGSSKLLQAYLAARAIASIHFTGVSHHTNAGLSLPYERNAQADITPKIIFDQSHIIEGALAEKVSLLNTRSDLLVKALEEQITFEKIWQSKNYTVDQHPDIIKDAASLTSIKFFERYRDVNPTFIKGIQKNLSDLIKKERDTVETYRVFYQASALLLAENNFENNDYATRFLSQYIDGIDLFIPSIREDLQKPEMIISKKPLKNIP